MGNQAAKGPTVKERIAALLASGRWYSLADIQEIIRGSSVRSRLQDLMREDRELPENQRRYQQRVVRSDTGRAPYKAYRARPAVKTALFDDHVMDDLKHDLNEEFY